jgi:hypothetical protein
LQIKFFSSKPKRTLSIIIAKFKLKNYECPLSGMQVNVSGNKKSIMYHLYILIRNKYHGAKLSQNGVGLVANDDECSYTFTDKIDFNLFWIGAVEVLLILLGVIATENLKPFLFTFDYAVTGIIMSIIVAYVFRNDVPDQPISFHNKEESSIA